MSKKLIFRTEVMSHLFGTFRAGDTATGIDPVIAADLVASGHAVWADGDAKAQADAAAEAAGRITDATQARPVARDEHSFSVGSVSQQVEAGIVKLAEVDKAPTEGAAPAVAEKPAQAQPKQAAAAKVVPDKAPAKTSAKAAGKSK